MKIRYVVLLSFLLTTIGCPEEETPPVKESLYSKLQGNNNNNEETVNDAGAADGSGDGTVDDSTDGGADGSADGDVVSDSGPVVNPGPGGGIDVALDFGTVANGSVEIVMNSGVAIAGFQFVFSGAAIASHSGGIVENLPSSWQVQTAANGTVLGFKISANDDIEPINDTLMFLNIGAAAENELCISEVTISSAAGTAFVSSPGTGETKCTPAP